MVWLELLMDVFSDAHVCKGNEHKELDERQR